MSVNGYKRTLLGRVSEVRFTPNSRHEKWYVRFRADFVRFTPKCRRFGHPPAPAVSLGLRKFQQRAQVILICSLQRCYVAVSHLSSFGQVRSPPREGR